MIQILTLVKVISSLLIFQYLLFCLTHLQYFYYYWWDDLTWYNTSWNTWTSELLKKSVGHWIRVFSKEKKTSPSEFTFLRIRTNWIVYLVLWNLISTSIEKVTAKRWSFQKLFFPSTLIRTLLYYLVLLWY